MPSQFQEALPLLIPLALIGGMAGGSTGFGIYLVIGPALWSVLSPAESMGAALSSGLPIWALLLPLRKHIPWKESRDLLLWASPGLGAGIVLHLLLETSWLQAGAALAIFAAVATRYLVRRKIASAPAGFLAGTLSSSVGFNGPPVFLGFADRNEKAMRSGIIFCLMILSLAASCILLLAKPEEFLQGYLLGLLLLPLVSIGVFLGNLLAQKIGKSIEWAAVAISLVGAMLLLLQSAGF